MRQVFSILVNNHPGVLSHVAGLFTRRSYNIESIVAAPTVDKKITRMVIVSQVEEEKMNQIGKQLSKLYDVKSVEILPYEKEKTKKLFISVLDK
ncbi:MAG: acetolactate synthase small subunit [Nitrospinota bacterium]|nr:acetolactate synthase small subunit [Nitrospinota bacterium]